MFLYITTGAGAGAVPNLPVAGGGTSSLAALGVLDPEGVFQDTITGLNKTSETDPMIWQWLGLRRKDRGSGAYRKQMRESEVLEFLAGDHAATKPHAEDAVESFLIREGVGLLLRDLSPAKRRVVEAHYFEGLTLKEISQDPEFGGLSVPALKSQLLRTREELLKRCIERPASQHMRRRRFHSLVAHDLRYGQRLRAQGLRRDADEQVVVLFCYDDQTALPAMLDTLAGAPTLLLATPGPAARQMRAQPARPGLRVVELPWLPQPAFDRLLWCADLAFVRGEDSIVRAQWAGVPFVWQIYPQHDGAHGPKLQAFLDAFLAHAPAEVGAPLRALWRRWNGLADPAGRAPGPMVLPARPAWAGACVAWRDALLAQAPLTAQLIAFVDGKRAGTG